MLLLVGCLQGHEGDDALQPHLQLGDDEHPRLRDQGQQPLTPQAADAGLPLRPELARDGRVLRRRRATATPDLQGQVQLLPRERASSPRPVRVDGARLLGLSPHTTTSSRSSSIDLCNTRMTTSSSSRSCRGRDENANAVALGFGFILCCKNLELARSSSSASQQSLSVTKERTA